MKQQRRNSGTDALATGLGLFSIGLGLAEIAAPRGMARLIGVRDDDEMLGVVRAYGARELANGVAILAEPDRAAWLWGRVGGDAVDLATLAQAEKTDSSRTAAAAAAVLGVTALDVLCAVLLGRQNGSTAAHGAPTQVRVVEAITVNRPIDTVYGFWRRFENFPRFMRYIESIESSGTRSHWRVKGPGGVRVEWDAELIEDRPNERLSWRTAADADVEHHGSVRFGHAPGSRGTELLVDISYRPPAGKVGRGIAWLLGSDPEAQVREDVRRFKQILETGEVTLSDGPALSRPAQPHEHPDRLKQLAGVQS